MADKKVLVVNAGSSSIKFTLYNMKDEHVIARGLVERLNAPGWGLKFKIEGKEIKDEGPETLDHRGGMQKIFEHLGDRIDGLYAMGHRVVHGGENFCDPVLITDHVVKAIHDLIPLAPLHNPPAYQGIIGSQELFPQIPMVAVFDTAFHQTMPERAFLYAIPHDLYDTDRIRRYGFHGTSHRFVSQECAKILGRENDPNLKIVSCHLGNGSSMCAIKGGKSIDTTMGLTPLEGLVMGTRCGDLDPAIVMHLIRQKHMTPDEVDKLLNKGSGLKGVSGIESGDMRDVVDNAEQGNKNARRAFELCTYRIKKYIGAYTAALGGLDALIFTAGIGENQPKVRWAVCDDMEHVGISVDRARNDKAEKLISNEKSKVKVFVIPTNEELMIARDTLSIVDGK